MGNKYVLCNKYIVIKLLDTPDSKIKLPRVQIRAVYYEVQTFWESLRRHPKTKIIDLSDWFDLPLVSEYQKSSGSDQLLKYQMHLPNTVKADTIMYSVDN